MTVQNTNTRTEHVADISQLAYSYDFLLLDASHVLVFINSEPYTAAFTVSGVGDEEGGLITFQEALPNGTDGDPLLFTRSVPATQLTDYISYDGFPAESHEKALDKLTMLVQDQASATGSFLRLPLGEAVTDSKITLPDLATRIQSFFIWDSVGNIISVKVEELLEYIGGTVVEAGDGLYEDYDPADNSYVINVGPGAGIGVSADSVYLNLETLPTGIYALFAGDGLNSNNDTLNVGAGAGIEVDANTVSVDSDILDKVNDSIDTAGSGLTKENSTINVGQGSGLTVNEDDVQISAPNLTILANADSGNIGKDDTGSYATDLNTLNESGMYACEAGALNNPNAEDGFLLVVGSDTGTGQIFMDRNPAEGALNIYYRTSLADTWTDWDVCITTENVLQILNAEFITFVDDGVSTPQHDNVQEAVTAALTAIGTRFDPTISGLFTAIEVQTALDQVAAIIEFISSGLQFEGVWNATTNEPPIDTFTPNQGDFYMVSVAGTTDLSNPPGTPDPAGDPLNNWNVLDIAIYDAVLGDNNYIGWGRIPDSGRITYANNVSFDDTNYVISFPTEVDPNPPQTSQAAHDKVWPFARNTLISGVGIQAAPGIADIAVDMRSNSFNVSLPTTVGHPPLVPGDKVALISGGTDIDGNFPLLGITDSDNPRMFMAHVTGGVLSDWLEMYTLTAPMTKAYIDDIISKADAGNIGEPISGPSNFTTSAAINGFFNDAIGGTTAFISCFSSDSSYGFQIGVNHNLGRDLVYRVKSDDVVNAFQNIFYSETRNSAQANTILSNADLGNIGKADVASAGADLNDLHTAGFYRSDSGTLNTPIDTNGSLIVTGHSATATTQIYTDVDANSTISWIRTSTIDGWAPWSEIFNSQDRTSAQANVILDNADLGNIGKADVTSAGADLNDLHTAGFYRSDFGTLNTPINTNGSLIVTGHSATATTQIYTYVDASSTISWIRTSTINGWAPWSEIFCSSTRTSAEANDIITKADLGGSGNSVTVPQYTDLDAVVVTGFSKFHESTPNAPTASAGLVYTNIWDVNFQSQIAFVANSGSPMYYRIKASGVWDGWKSSASNLDLDDYLPLVGGTLSGKLTIDFAPVSADTELLYTRSSAGNINQTVRRIENASFAAVFEKMYSSTLRYSTGGAPSDTTYVDVITSTGQVGVSATVPTAVNHLARKDYVDGQISDISGRRVVETSTVLWTGSANSGTHTLTEAFEGFDIINVIGGTTDQPTSYRFSPADYAHMVTASTTGHACIQASAWSSSWCRGTFSGTTMNITAEDDGRIFAVIGIRNVIS